MRSTLNPIACLFLTLSCVIAFSGCAAIDRAITKPAQPVTQTVTNAQGQVFSATYTPVELDPAFTPYVETGKAVVSVLPSPAREIGGGLLAVLLGAAGTYVRTRNKIKSAEAAAEASHEMYEAADDESAKIDASLRSVISAVEKIGTPEIKTAIQKQAIKDDTENHLRTVVNQVTS